MLIPKYRIWSKTLREFVKNTSIRDIRYYVSHEGLCYDLRDGTQGPDSFIIDTFTGIEDVNGKDIFTGDKVKMLGNPLQPIKGICGIVHWSSAMSAFVIMTESGFIERLKLSDEYEVIGNVHL